MSQRLASALVLLSVLAACGDDTPRRTPPPNLDLLEYDLKTKKSTLVWQAAGSVSFAATNVEHTRFALVDTHSDANTDVYVIDRNEKKSPRCSPSAP